MSAGKVSRRSTFCHTKSPPRLNPLLLRSGSDLLLQPTSQCIPPRQDAPGLLQLIGCYTTNTRPGLVISEAGHRHFGGDAGAWGKLRYLTRRSFASCPQTDLFPTFAQIYRSPSFLGLQLSPSCLLRTSSPRNLHRPQTRISQLQPPPSAQSWTTQRTIPGAHPAPTATTLTRDRTAARPL